MKKVISFFVALLVPILAACGSSRAVAESAPTPEPPPSAMSQPAESAQPRWSPPEETTEPEAEPQPAPEVVQEAPEVVQEALAEEVAQKQAFFHAGVPNKEILEILGKPNRSQLGQDSKHVYYDCEYQGIQFKSIEVDMTDDGTVWLVVLVADDTLERQLIESFTQKWAEALQTDNGTPAVFHSDDPLSLKYDWNDETLTLDKYPGGSEYHIGVFWKLYY